MHRIVNVHLDADGEYKLLTKGDNNTVNDVSLYSDDMSIMWIDRTDIVGRMRFLLPHVGRLTLTLNDHPLLKGVVLFLMGLIVISNRDG